MVTMIEVGCVEIVAEGRPGGKDNRRGWRDRSWSSEDRDQMSSDEAASGYLDGRLEPGVDHRNENRSGGLKF